MKRRRAILSIIVLTGLILTAGCGKTLPSLDTAPTPTPYPTPEPVTVTGIDVAADPPVAVDEPYEAVDPYTMAEFSPDRKLYNALYFATESMSPSLDISGFVLPFAEKESTISSLYAQTSFALFYLEEAFLSEDGETVTFVYREDKQTVWRHRETYLARLSHVLYNIAPDTCSSLQRLMAVYVYLCDTSELTEDAPDGLSPYSILTEGRGDTAAYADLMYYVLNRLGVRTEYVTNGDSAWDIVQLDGHWYHMDAACGAQGRLHGFLMDDTARRAELAAIGQDTEEMILGYPHHGAAPPFPCQDQRFAGYGRLLNEFAVDVDGGKVYFADGDTIKRMNLDCTGTETLAEKRAGQMVFYDGVLFFAGAYDGFLYQLTPGHTPALVDNSLWTAYLKRKGAALYYGPKADGSECKIIRLTHMSSEETRYAEMLEFAVMPRSRSFSFNITFSGKMDPGAHWENYVYLLDGYGEALPLHLQWSDDGRTLNVRSQDCVADMGTVTLYVAKGAPSANGARITRTVGRHVLIESDCPFSTSKYREKWE